MPCSGTSTEIAIIFLSQISMSDLSFTTLFDSHNELSNSIKFNDRQMTSLFQKLTHFLFQNFELIRFSLPRVFYDLNQEFHRIMNSHQVEGNLYSSTDTFTLLVIERKIRNHKDFKCLQVKNSDSEIEIAMKNDNSNRDLRHF